MSTGREGQHPEGPGARDADEHVPTHTRRGFLIAAGTGVAVTGVGIWLSTSSGGEADVTGRPDNPRGLSEYEPVYDRAVTGLEVPLGFEDCAHPTVRADRGIAGSERRTVSPVIDRFIIHDTGTTTDQLDFFSRCNRRSSAPTFYLRHDGSVIETIRPGAKPSSTGADWHWRSVAVETLDFTGAPEYTSSPTRRRGRERSVPARSSKREWKTSLRGRKRSSRRHEAGAVRDNRGVRHLLSLTELTWDDLREIFARAARIEAGTLARRDGAAALFFPSSSLRTRVSFERGAAEMGLQPIVFPPEALDTVEDAVDIVGYLSAWVELLVVRHADLQVLRELAAPGILPVVNAMTDANHPCEVLSDLFALSRETDVRSLRVLVVGPDGNIARAWEEAHRAFGIDVVQACPEKVRTPALPWKEDLSDAVQEADVIITDGPGEHSAAMAPYRITADLLDSAPDGVRFAPCPPFVRGREVSVAAANHPAFVGYEFKRHLKSVQQAIMGWAFEG